MFLRGGKMNGFKYVRCETTRNTMDELARVLKVSKQAVYTWESGKKKIPEKRLNQLSEKDKLAIKKYRLDKEIKELEQIKQDF